MVSNCSKGWKKLHQKWEAFDLITLHALNFWKVLRSSLSAKHSVPAITTSWTGCKNTSCKLDHTWGMSLIDGPQCTTKAVNNIIWLTMARNSRRLHKWVIGSLIQSSLTISWIWVSDSKWLTKQLNFMAFFKIEKKSTQINNQITRMHYWIMLAISTKLKRNYSIRIMLQSKLAY